MLAVVVLFVCLFFCQLNDALNFKGESVVFVLNNLLRTADVQNQVRRQFRWLINLSQILFLRFFNQLVVLLSM